LFFHAVGTDEDHLHILVEAAPRYSPSQIMMICKSITTKEIFKRFPELREDLWGGHFWTEGGHIDTTINLVLVPLIDLDNFSVLLSKSEKISFTSLLLIPSL